jgi:hypothetical protein
MALVALTVVATSCADLDITKRKYRPGFHVSTSGKKDNRKAEETASVKERKANKAIAADASETVVEQEVNASATASAATVAAPITGHAPKQKVGEMLRSDYEWFKNTMFNRAKVRSEVNKLVKPMYGARNDWMAWACFGAGIASMVFGFFGILAAFLWASPLWAAAILFGVAAIVFGFIHKKNAAGGEQWRRLGFIFGWVGLGLGVIGMIIYIAWIAAALSPLL